MSKTAQAALGFLGFIAVSGLLMSDRFQDMADVVPESLYFWVTAILVLGMTVVGFYAWWQHYNGRKMHPTVDRLKKWWESPSWWLWPF